MKTILYLGTDPTSFARRGDWDGHLIHFPVIEIIPKTPCEPSLQAAYDHLPHYTHLLFTSKNSVRIFFQHMKELRIAREVLSLPTFLAIGSVTAAHLHAHGFPAHHVAEEESQEGLILLLEQLPLQEAYFFFPRSVLSRPLLIDYLREKKIRFQATDLYDTRTRKQDILPNLDRVDEIVFTSPSTVRGFLEIFGELPSHKKLLAVGPVTQQALEEAARTLSS